MPPVNRTIVQDTLGIGGVTPAPDLALGHTSIPPSLDHIKGYQVTAIVVCIIVVLAVIMCQVTWRLRFRIVLRQKDPNQQSTVVQNLVALELQYLKSGGEDGDEQAVLFGEAENPEGLDSNVLVPVTQISDEDGPSFPPGFTENDIELSDIKEEIEKEVEEQEGRDEGVRGGADERAGSSTMPTDSGEGKEEKSSRHDQVMARLMSVPVMPNGSGIRGRSTKRKGRKHTHMHTHHRSSRLSSGLSLPRRVDVSRLMRSGKHPLILEEEEESPDSSAPPSPGDRRQSSPS